MTYSEYIAYHLQGDAGVEERAIASLCKALSLSSWESFRLIYYYTMTYHLPSALELFRNPNIAMSQLKFRTDRRYVRCHGAYPRLLKNLTEDKHRALLSCKTTSEAYDVVSSWYFFGRYASFLFLEVYMNTFKPDWIDNLKFKWEEDENYTKGAVIVAGGKERSVLDAFLEKAKADTKDNCFAIETSLCAVEKIRKGTRWNGYYTERFINELKGNKYEALILRLL